MADGQESRVKDTASCKKLLLPAFAGILAACGGLCMKLGINNTDLMLKTLGLDIENKRLFTQGLSWVLMIFFIVLGILFNGGNQKYYVISLKFIGASLTVAITFITNYIWSVICNYFVWGTLPTGGQYIGSLCFVAGQYFIAFQACFSKKPKHQEIRDHVLFLTIKNFFWSQKKMVCLPKNIFVVMNSK